MREDSAPRFTDGDLRVISRLAREEVERRDPSLLVYPPEQDIAARKRNDARRLLRKAQAVRQARKPPPEPPY